MSTTAIATQAPIIARPWTSESNPGKDYYLLVCRSDNLAIDCTCPDREHRGRKAHRPCKHMKRYNTRVVLQMLADWMSGLAAALQVATVEIPTAEITEHQECGLDQAVAEYLRHENQHIMYEALGTTKQPIGHLSKEEREKRYEQFQAFESGITGLGNV